MTQGAVSRQIKALEEALQLRLFRRLTRSIEITSDGQRRFDVVSKSWTS